MSAITSVRCLPAVGTSNSTVTVDWKFGYDVSWEPTTNDELRLLTTSGVLVARVSLRGAQPRSSGGRLNGSPGSSQAPFSLTDGDLSTSSYPLSMVLLREAACVLPTAPFGGSFVIAFIDCVNNFKRVFTIPYRIIGPEFLPAITLHLQPSPIHIDRSRHAESIDVTENDDGGGAGSIDVTEVVEPHQRLTVRFDAATLPPLAGGTEAVRTSTLRFVLCKSQLGDNSGYSAFGVGVYDHCTSVSRVPVEALTVDLRCSPTSGPLYHTAALIAPAEEETYEVRLMTMPPTTGLPYSIARSLPFRVQQRCPRVTRGRLYGSIRLNRQRCMAGEALTLAYEISSADTHLLSRLDSVGFFPYGRPEAMPHPDALHTSVMEAVGKKTIAVRAPSEPGVFEAALYSFLEQQPVLLSEPIVVLPPQYSIELSESFVSEQGMQPRATLNGKAVWSMQCFVAVFRVLAPACLYHPRDRLVLVDEGSNVVYQARIQVEAGELASSMLFSDEYAECNTSLRCATVDIRHPIPGKYTVHYFSFCCGRFVHQAPLYLELMGDARHTSPLPHLPTGAISVLGSLPEDAAMEVMFKKEGADSRPLSMQLMDCICLYMDGAPDVTCAPFLDASSATPHLACYYLRGNASETFFLPSLEEIRRKIRSALVHSHGNDDDDGASEAAGAPPRSVDGAKSCISAVNMRDDVATVRNTAIGSTTANKLLKPFYTAELLEALNATTTFSVRYHACLDGYLQRVCVSEAFVTILPRSKVASTFRAVPLRQVAVRELAMISHRHTSAMTDGSLSGVVTPIAMSRRPAAMFSSGSKGRALRFLRQDDHDFRGAILAPRGCDATDAIVVTFHITDGMPRADDKLLLFSAGGTIPIVHCPVSLATDARPDFTLGTVLLKPPALEGSYVVGYFSSRLEGVVLTSEPVRVIATGSHCGSAPDGKRRARVIGGSSCQSKDDAPRAAPNETPTMPSLIHTSSRPERLPRCKVLLVGVSYFQQPHELKGPLNDVEAMTDMARRFFIRDDANGAFPATGAPCGTDHLLRVLQETETDPLLKPTADNILRGLAWLAEDVVDGDQLVFYFSGAGSVLPDGSRVLLPVDFDWHLRVVTPAVIMDALVLKVPPTVATTVLLDCCNYTTRLEAFRREELRLLSAGEEELHLGWGGLQRRRKYQGVGVAPWRCIPPSKGTHEENVAAASEEPTCHFPAPMMDVSMLCSSGSPSSATARPLAVVYEACRSAHGWGDGAWDVFVRDAGVTRGLFTHFLCSIMDREQNPRALEKGEIERGAPLLWFELHGRMLRAMEEVPYHQAPRLWIGGTAALTSPVAHSAVGFGMESHRQSGDVW